jgi:hypothetical protein
MEEGATMWRVTPALKKMVDDLLEEVQKDPILSAQVGDSNGHVSRASLIRVCISRGAASVRGEIRNRTPVVEQVVKPATKKPASKSKKRRK